MKLTTNEISGLVPFWMYKSEPITSRYGTSGEGSSPLDKFIWALSVHTDGDMGNSLIFSS
ncbi:unnamed protein product, partial [Nesidiocoris tenuis]